MHIDFIDFFWLDDTFLATLSFGLICGCTTKSELRISMDTDFRLKDIVCILFIILSSLRRPHSQTPYILSVFALLYLPPWDGNSKFVIPYIPPPYMMASARKQTLFRECWKEIR